MSARRKRRAPSPAGSWSWVYNGRALVGVLQQRGDGWRAIRVGDDGHDREVKDFATRQDAIEFVNAGSRDGGG